MSDLPSSIALQMDSAKPKTGEELEVLGKEAATRYTQGASANLTEAVVDVVKTAGLSPEQVRRVTEFANIDAFHQDFRKEGAGHRVVEFDGGPADFPTILRDLNDGGGGTVFDKHAFDYSSPPPDVPGMASTNEDLLGLENEKLASAFGVEEEPLPFVDPMRPALDMQDKLARMESEITADLNHLEGQYLDVVDGLVHEVKQASLTGTDLGQIVQAWSTVTDHPEYIKAAFAQLTPRLLEGEVFPSKGAIGESLMKTASSGVTNPEHPLVVRFQDFCETLTKMAEARAARTEVTGHQESMAAFVKSAGSKMEAAKKAWGATTEAARKAAPVVGETLRGAGNVAGDVAETVVPYAPHLAVVGAGLKAREEVRYSPKIQRALSHVPGTKQYKAKRYYQGYR